MKTQTLLLGEYASSAFYIYTIPSSNATHTTDFLAIQDLYQLFFHHSPSDINPLFYTFFQSYPQHFYHDQRNQCYIAKQHVLTLARCLQLFALAEFCTLTHDELINRIADPLFATTNALMLRPVTPKRIDMDLDWFPLPDHSFFSSFLSSAAARYSNADIDCSHPDNAAVAAAYHPHRRLPYFSAHKQNDHSWSRHFLPLPHIGMERALRAQKQQQAVIECRQRVLVYHQSSSTTKKEKQQAKKPGISNSVTASSPVNNALESSHHHHHHHHHQRKRKSLSPPSSSPPAESHPQRHLHDDLRLPPPPFYFTDHHRTKKIKSSSSSSYNNNLDLLATQATKLKGLPLSPEISPPPPPVLSLPPISSTSASFYSSSFIQSLPSIRNVLSDI